MANLMKVTVDAGTKEPKTQEVIINLDQVISVLLLEGFKGNKWLRIVTVGKDIDGPILYSVTEEPYALALFEEISKWLWGDFSWQALIGKQQD
jgi:hypothetical protein